MIDNKKLDNSLVAISDCDHDDMDIEQGVLAKNGLVAPWFNCTSEDDLIRELQGFKSVINQYAPFTEKVFANLPDLKVIVRYGVGVDNIDLDAATKHGVKICNVPDYGTAEVADQAMAMMLALTRKICFNDRLVKSGVWEYQRSIPIYRQSTQTLGIVGLGRIGSAFAERAKGFGFNIIAHDPNGRSLDFVEMVSMDKLLKEADIISIHCPLDGNKGLISEEQLNAMKKSSYIINVSRGGIINESDLYNALKNNIIAGAACDVFMPEPIDSSNPLLTLDNFVVSPHIAWYSEQASEDLQRKVAEEAARGGLGQTLLNVVNK